MATPLSEFVWSPDEARLERANLTRLMRRFGVERYAELHRISIDEPERFWPEVVDDLGLEFTQPWHRVLDTSRGIEWATWFVGGRVNVARNCVHRWAARKPDETAAVFLGEDGTRRERTWADLSRETTQLAEALVELGVESGVPRGRRRLARVRARGRDPGAGLLRVRGVGRAPAARGVGGEGRDLRRLVAAPGPADGDARDAR